MQCSRCRLPLLGRVLPTAALLAALLYAATPSPAAAQADCLASSEAEVEAIARAYFDAFNSGDVAALDALLAPDYRHQGAVVSPQDRALHLDRLRAVREAFPDGVYAIEWLIVEGDTVVVRHNFRGTHQGEYVDVPASGKPVAVGAFHAHRVACGRIAETWNAADGLGLFRQIGAIPGPPTTPTDEEAKPAEAAAQPADCPATTPEENVAAARRWYDEVLNQGRFEVLDEILAEDVVHHGGVMVDSKDRAETADALRALLAGFPDIQYTVDDAIEDGDTVVIRWTGKGTHQGEFLGVAPSGAAVDWSGINAFRFACGRVVEGWSEANGFMILRQIGGIE